MSDHDSRPLGDHDIRQAGYRGGTADVAEDSGVPRGRGRDVPSRTAPRQDAQGLPDTDADDPGADRSGRTQPNFGQGGTYAATGEHAGGAHGKPATGGYHEDASGDGGGRDERAEDRDKD
ncbi:hypothetical protein QSH18_14510 [Xanthomonas sp. NCPPB 2654]|uniref:hypothetical protein n=1 Tax=unclassified Xanthomonas TaxID=2643310 RepID=UPI0021E055DB|nr:MULTISPECIES: hypothetical protein [unclassified Xanthomonas]MDL5366819.1 hypothetical protein [Xanthomonas sp. NCPPB 2654]UYC20090.1 hypothetical protein NUG20_18290 [Xanthomonas sp. CFBP 8443]